MRCTIRFYLSHSIRGAKGATATPLQMEANCNKVLLVAAEIQRAVPMVDLYVPADHEDFVYVAFKDKYLTEQQILEIDCKIIDTRDGIIVYCPPDDPMCGGRTIEYEHALATGKPVLVFQAPGEAISWLTNQIMRA